MQQVELFAPPEYWRTPPDERSRWRCGPGSGLGDWLVPDTMYGLSVSPACSIHDFMYSVGEIEDDRREADEVFLNNLLRLIDAAGGWLRRLRYRRAYDYYLAVRRFGGPAFWDNKNKPAERGRVTI